VKKNRGELASPSLYFNNNTLILILSIDMSFLNSEMSFLKGEVSFLNSHMLFLNSDMSFLNSENDQLFDIFRLRCTSRMKIILKLFQIIIII
jgi:hypothetical protein